jgi:hypothetical protein
VAKRPGKSALFRAVTGSLDYVGPQSTLDGSATFTEPLEIALLGTVSFVGGYELMPRRGAGHTRSAVSSFNSVGRRSSRLHLRPSPSPSFADYLRVRRRDCDAGGHLKSGR